ncbi:hypothetical protein Q5P01_019087 [Channa striata]|uniref:Uncharacterized protein n=1 Tax=Channa striata TaxID=64152 RepID=A0AA88M1T0_CHASR|nr:hypothetical protein Q5P01_019087 [Channa striata]
METSVAQGCTFTGGRFDPQFPFAGPAAVGLAPERERLERLGFPPAVVQTIQGARAPSTTALYAAKWSAFQRWCLERNMDPASCPLSQILTFLQLLVERNLALSTVKTYTAAISSCHEGFGERSVFAHPLVKRFLKGVRRQRPVTRSITPQWELPLVLHALRNPPFEPLSQISLKFLSLKTALLLALTSAKRVSDLCALSVSPSCLTIREDESLAVLRPNPAFMPKIITSSFRSRMEEDFHRLCPVRALSHYVARTAGVRRTQQLFVHYREHSQGKPLTKQRLSHWLCDAITQAYVSAGKEPPQNMRAHSTRAVSSSTALFNGMSVDDICAAASWASPCPFVRFYLRDTSEFSLTHSVLGVLLDQRTSAGTVRGLPAHAAAGTR